LEPAASSTEVVDIDATSIASTYDQGLALISSRSDRVELLNVDPDGTVRRDPVSSLPSGLERTENECFIVGGIETFSAMAGVFAGRLAVLAGSPITCDLIFGSLRRADGLDGARSWIVPVNGDVIVRPAAGAPQDVRYGQMWSCTGLPQIHSNPAIATLVFRTVPFTLTDRRSMLIKRAVFHPLLRVDAAVRASTVNAYGVAGPTQFNELVESSIRQVIADSDAELLKWWWTLDHALTPLAGGPIESMAIRGRFPAGVGINERAATEAGFVVRSGNYNLHVPHACRELLAQFVSGEPIVCSDQLTQDSAHELLRCGLAEPIIGALRSTFPLLENAIGADL
jgi:hypothetical protein